MSSNLYCRSIVFTILLIAFIISGLLLANNKGSYILRMSTSTNREHACVYFLHCHHELKPSSKQMMILRFVILSIDCAHRNNYIAVRKSYMCTVRHMRRCLNLQPTVVIFLPYPIYRKKTYLI